MFVFDWLSILPFALQGLETNLKKWIVGYKMTDSYFILKYFPKCAFGSTITTKVKSFFSLHVWRVYPFLLFLLTHSHIEIIDSKLSLTAKNGSLAQLRCIAERT